MPADFAPPGGLSGDRETATAQAAAECLKRAGVREVVAEFDRPALLFSGGKDSAVLLHVARKALAPAPLPITLVHVDTGHNLPGSALTRVSPSLPLRIGLTVVVLDFSRLSVVSMVLAPPCVAIAEAIPAALVLLSQLNRTVPRTGRR